MAIENTLWVEKYRPIKLKDYIGNETLKKKAQKYIDAQEIQNMLLYGAPGTGKTTFAKLLIKNIPCDYLMLNASDENSIDTIRTKVINFATSVSITGKYKIIILDEADGLTPQAQKSLRNVIEKYSAHTRYILTCNYPENIIGALKSRCRPTEIKPMTTDEVKERMITILEKEKVKYNIDDIDYIISLTFPDVRACIETLQENVFINELSINKKTLNHSDYCAKIKNIIFDKKNEKNFFDSFDKIKQILVESGSNNFEELYLYMYNAVEEFGNAENIASAIEVISENQYRSNFTINKEITAMNMICKLFNLIRQ